MEYSPKTLGFDKGWLGDVTQVFSIGKYAVMARNVQTEWGAVKHVCMRNAASTDIPWREKQRIKNELFGEDTFLATKVFPIYVRKPLV